MSLISAVPAAQARKNKKVKKLLMEGVPSSVRYLVWAHLMDSKARGMPGLYSQLGKRGKVPAFNNIEHDAQICYPGHPQLHTAQGTLVALLQSYLTMVPDIQYETGWVLWTIPAVLNWQIFTGLTSIAGRLLILAPDEDAFWIFVSLMDTYLRPWFSVNTIQMEVDASLFSKALETNDGQVAKKLYVELGLSQAAVCRPWYAAFLDSLVDSSYLMLLLL
jgi:TBC1 domain family member 10